MKDNKTLRILHFLLFLNSLIGISCYPSFALISIFIMGLGIPGFVFLFVNFFSAFRKKTRKPVNEIGLAIAIAAYNFVIFTILLDFNDPHEWINTPIIKTTPAMFPRINLILSLFYFTVAVINYYTNKKTSHDSDDHAFSDENS